MNFATKLALAGLLATGLETAWATAASAGCRVTFQGRNGSQTITYKMMWEASQVRNRLGTWRHLPATPDQSNVQPGRTFSLLFYLDFGCNVDRRYRFTIYPTAGERSNMAFEYYYPSSSSFTRDTVINFGDINRFFPH